MYSTHFLCICATQALASAQVQLNERSDELVIRTRRVKNLEQQLEDVEEAHKYVALFFFLVCISLAPRLLVCISLPTRHEQGCGRGAQVCVSIHLSSCLFASLLQRGMVKGVKECPGGVHKYTQQLKHTCSLTDTHTHRGTDINRTHQHKHTHKCACAHTRTHTNMRSHKTAHMRSTATYTHIQIHAYTNAHMHTQGSWCMPTCYRGGGGGAEHAPDHMAAQTHIHIHAHTRTHTHTKQTCTHTHICTHRGAGACIRALEEEVEELNTRLIMWQHNHGHDPMIHSSGGGAAAGMGADKVSARTSESGMVSIQHTLDVCVRVHVWIYLYTQITPYTHTQVTHTQRLKCVSSVGN